MLAGFWMINFIEYESNLNFLYSQKMTQFNVNSEAKKYWNRENAISQLRETMCVCFIFVFVICCICLSAIFIRTIRAKNYSNNINKSLEMSIDDNNDIVLIILNISTMILMLGISLDILYWNHRLKSIVDNTYYLLFVIDKKLNQYNHELMHKRALIYHIDGFLDD